jgi:hypothetical protein
MAETVAATTSADRTVQADRTVRAEIEIHWNTTERGGSSIAT